MKRTDDKKVQELLDGFEMLFPDQFEIVLKLREIVFKVHPDTKEKVMYGGIMFSLSDDFGGVFGRKKHVSFEFANGFELKDPGKLLEGKG